MTCLIDRLIVDTQARTLTWPGGSLPCAIGRGGAIAAADKQEGDKLTPLGCYPLRGVYVRTDRRPIPQTALPVYALTPTDGWCDASEDPAYNRPVQHPYPASAEHLWREDGLYNLIVVLGHNDDPPLPGRGSAIFLHCCAYEETGAFKPTLGCITLEEAALADLLACCGPQTLIDIR